MDSSNPNFYIIVDEAACKGVKEKTWLWASHEGFISPIEAKEEIKRRGGKPDMIVGHLDFPSLNPGRAAGKATTKKISSEEETKQLIVVMSDQHKEAMLLKFPQKPAILNLCVSKLANVPEQKINSAMNTCENIITSLVEIPVDCKQISENTGIFLVDNNASGRFVASQMLKAFQYEALKEDSANKFLEKFPIMAFKCIILRYSTVPSLQSKLGDKESSEVPYLCIPSDFMEEMFESIVPETRVKVLMVELKNKNELYCILNDMFGKETEINGTVSNNSTDKKRPRMKLEDNFEKPTAWKRFEQMSDRAILNTHVASI